MRIEDKNLRKMDSVVVLERRESTAPSPVAFVDHLSPSASQLERGHAADASPIAIDLSVRYGRVALLTTSVVAVVAGLTVLFNRGVEITRFDAGSKSTSAQTKLLDKYNSYTGNVSSLFGKPIEVFVALTVQVVALRLFATRMLHRETGWKLTTLTLGASAAIGYLIGNAFNALNVQLRPQEIQPVISASDLAFVSEVAVSDAAARSSNITQTISEDRPRNPIQNTVLRNLVVPRALQNVGICSWRDSAPFRKDPKADRVVEYGFSQRDWQARLLQEALEPKQLHMVLNASKPHASESVDASKLPMNATLAADLLMYGLLMGPTIFPWKSEETPYYPDVAKRFPNEKVDLSTARVRGVLPPSATDDEATQRTWFLREGPKALLEKLAKADNTSQSDVVMTFSSVDISRTMRFDAVTIEFDVAHRLVTDAQSKDNSTRYFDIDWYTVCGPWPARCMMPKPVYVSEMTPAKYDPPAQVQAFGSCVDSNGLEQLTAAITADKDMTMLETPDCLGVSNSSLMVMSIGKRFVADAFSQNKTANASGVFSSESGQQALFTNLRRVYSYTIGRLSWQLSDLSTDFASTCATTGCKGLSLPLATTPSSPKHQQLIVGVDALPVSMLTPPTLDSGVRFLPLVEIHEAPQVTAMPNAWYDASAGDPLLPHNMGKITWGSWQPAPGHTGCNAVTEDRVYQVFSNHWYIEHGLQTAYTAATFSLFQNGVVRDVIKLSHGRPSLAFQHNTQAIVVLASIPARNAWFTLGGCAAVVVGIVVVLVMRSRTTGVDRVTAPHMVASVMLDSARYPPAFIHRQVVGASGDKAARSATAFEIDGLALHPKRG